MQIGCYVNVTSRLFSSADNHPPRRLLELNLYIHFPNILLERLQGSCLMLSCLQAVIRQKGSSPSSSDCISFVPFLWSDRALALSSSSPSYNGVCFQLQTTHWQLLFRWQMWANIQHQIMGYLLQLYVCKSNILTTKRPSNGIENTMCNCVFVVHCDRN